MVMQSVRAIPSRPRYSRTQQSSAAIWLSISRGPSCWCAMIHSWAMVPSGFMSSSRDRCTLLVPTKRPGKSCLSTFTTSSCTRYENRRRVPKSATCNSDNSSLLALALSQSNLR
ncbi:hypothetical protein D3C80_1839270 [compost metagenome]